MKPKETNKPIYTILNAYTDITQPDTTGPHALIIAYQLVDNVNGKVLTVPVSTYDKMILLRLIDPVWNSKYIPVYSYTIIIDSDESFLEQYIDHTDTRPTWDEYFMANAQLISARSTCDRLYVGCVLVKDKRIIATGYNGSISRHSHCSVVGHLLVEENGKMGCKRTVHAEKNALSMCAKLGISANGATAYVTHYPCPDCMRELNQAGIKEVVYGNFYQHRYSNDFHVGMDLREFKGKTAKIEWVEEN